MLHLTSKPVWSGPVGTLRIIWVIWVALCTLFWMADAWFTDWHAVFVVPLSAATAAAVFFTTKEPEAKEGEKQ